MFWIASGIEVTGQALVRVGPSGTHWGPWRLEEMGGMGRDGGGERGSRRIYEEARRRS